MRQLAQALVAGNTMERSLKQDEGGIDRLSQLLFGKDSDIIEIVFLPVDRKSLHAVHAVAPIWHRLLGVPASVHQPDALLFHPTEDKLVVVVSAGILNMDISAKRISGVDCPVVLVGDVLNESGSARAKNLTAIFQLEEKISTPSTEALYAFLLLLAAALWETQDVKKGILLKNHIKNSGNVITTVLNDRSLAESIVSTMAANKSYGGMSWVGPPTNIGFGCVGKFEEASDAVISHYVFGECIYSHLVTVDSEADRKFVLLKNRSRMLQLYGDQQIDEWEKAFLRGENIDDFLKNPPKSLPDQYEKPFYDNGNWHLPILKPGYETKNDNLVILDATSEWYFAPALDELATFGARYARIIVITQNALLNDAKKQSLYKYPISQLLTLPSIGDDFDSEMKSNITDIHLPFALFITAAAMADASQAAVKPHEA